MSNIPEISEFTPEVRELINAAVEYRHTRKIWSTTPNVSTRFADAVDAFETSIKPRPFKAWMHRGSIEFFEGPYCGVIFGLDYPGRPVAEAWEVLVTPIQKRTP